MSAPDRQPLPGCYWQIVVMLIVIGVVSLAVLAVSG